MQAENFNLADYLSRIGFTGKTAATHTTLTGIMRAHLFTIPFENIDVQAGKIVSLIPEDIVEKIVYKKRGGYCYEVNGLFAMALTAIGFEYTLIGARPMFYPTRRPKTHMALAVKADNQLWLCDLGFGSFGIRAPLLLSVADIVTQQDDDFFKIIKPDNNHFIMQALVNEVWTNQYGFDLYPHEWIDFFPVNFLNSKHPDTIFVQKLLIILHNPKGRTILLGNQLKTIENGVTHVKAVADTDIPAVLKLTFGLVAP
jgi:N-hydroxyarylamine O-acetyltransferase